LVALALLVGHFLFPKEKIDLLTLGFLVVAVVPWLASVFESFELPGGWKVKYRDLKAAGDIVVASAEKQAPVQVRTATASASAAIASSPLSEIADPNIRLVALRYEIERRLRELGRLYGIEKRGLRTLLAALAEAALLDSPTYNSLGLILDAGNRAAHGAQVSEVIGRWAATVGPVILSHLDYAHVRVSPPPVYIDREGVRRDVAPSGAVGVCQVRLASNMPDVVTLVVPLDGSYTVEIPRNRVHVVPLDETDHGYQLRAELQLVGLRIVIDPRQTHDVGEGGRRHIWTEPA
jgi:hypothetical protein